MCSDTAPNAATNTAPNPAGNSSGENECSGDGKGEKKKYGKYGLDRQLYVNLDATKGWGFAAMGYHRSNDGDTKKTAVQPIMFLS